MDTNNPYERHVPFLQGPTAIRHDILEYLKTALPTSISYAKQEWGDDVFLAAPQQYLPYEPLGISHRTGPILGVGIPSTQASEHVDFTNAMEQETLTRYSMRIYLWCYTPETTDDLVVDDARHETLRLRDDMSTILRSALFTEPGLNDPDRYSVHTDTIREEFSDGTQVPNSSGRYIAAVVISFAMDVEERLFRPVFGFVSDTDENDPGVDLQGGLLRRNDEQ